MNDFKECLDKANSEKLNPFWISVYKEMFPNFVEMTGTIGNMDMQRKGVDRLILLSNNRTILIDEKVRFSDYNDILIEYISVDTNNTPGWIEKQMDIDYLAYAFINKKTCYMIPFPALQRVWKYYKNIWIRKYQRIEAENKNYKTISVAIPTNTLLNKVSDAMKIKVNNYE